MALLRRYTTSNIIGSDRIPHFSLCSEPGLSTEGGTVSTWGTTGGTTLGVIVSDMSHMMAVFVGSVDSMGKIEVCRRVLSVVKIVRRSFCPNFCF